jgi:uncharacterized repeat protein (TIGR03803 family)
MWSLLSVTVGVFYFDAPREAEAQVTILYSFGSGQASDGVEPLGGLVEASDGSFYATTYAQLGNFSAMFPSGTIYQFQPSSGELAFLKSFPNRSQREPQSPVLPCKGGLVGVTFATNRSAGILFDLTASGTLEVWHQFEKGAPSNDGGFPFAPLLIGPKGFLYGVTESGGSDKSGTFYKVNPKNREVSIVHSFTYAGPSMPSGFLFGKDGNFYGIAVSKSSEAVIFMMTPAGAATTLYTFTGFPVNLTLMQASDGTFYGTTGGSASQYGTVFKMTGTPPNVTVTTLHVFGQGQDGTDPRGPVGVGPNGNLYGETASGGTGKDGTIYELTTDGSTYTILHNLVGIDKANGSNYQFHGRINEQALE